MCMLFMFTNPNPGPDGYLLILASVRDEFYHRPTQSCHFWERNPSIVGGMDLEEDKEGGTWLAMNTSGKISSLLNIMQPVDDLVGGQRNRGFLAVSYLESPIDGPSYLRTLKRDAAEFNAYLLVTIDLSPAMGQVRASCYSNTSTEPPIVLRPGVHVFGNSVPRRPWRKVQAARQAFGQLVSIHNRNTRKKDVLVQDLFTLLANRHEHYPDPQLARDAEGRPEECIRRLSAVFINIPEASYGSRTHSLILVDSRGQVDFIERTLQEPINAHATSPWEETRYGFTIQDPNSLISRL